MTADLRKENNALRAAQKDARGMLVEAVARLSAILDDKAIADGTPIEATTVMKLAIEAIEAAVTKLKAVATASKRTPVGPGGPTRQQGQFLAFIHEYMMRNHAGVAPTHANFQQFFNLTAPSVNSMLIRLERRGFIRRVPHQARAIELTVSPDWIPPLDRPYKLR
jgi:repressor LexA